MNEKGRNMFKSTMKANKKNKAKIESRRKEAKKKGKIKKEKDQSIDKRRLFLYLNCASKKKTSSHIKR